MEAYQCDHAAAAGPLWTLCAHCGSTCERDRRGVIKLFERGNADRPAWALANENLQTKGPQR